MEWKDLLSTARIQDTTRKINNFDFRNEFESDYGRIIFSPAVRRMHDKTQVFPLTTDDNIHSRLTHSLEVQSIAQSLGMNLIKRGLFKNTGISDYELIRVIPIILSSVSFCHDIGNPPFGHFGEKVIANYFNDYFLNNTTDLTNDEKLDFTKFDGNAQGFRVITKLQVLQDTAGLNLTAGTLASFLKYPVFSSELQEDSSKKYLTKIGVFQSEKEHLSFIRETTKLINVRHPLVYLMEAADNICYFSMDIEDGFNKKYYTFEFLLNYLKTHGNTDVRKFLKETDLKIKKRLKSDINIETTKMVNFRIYLIQHLVAKTVKVFEKNYKSILSGEYYSELIFDDKEGNIAEVLQQFQIENIFCKREIEKLELTGESVIKGLFNHFVNDLLKFKVRKGNERAKKLLSLISGSLQTIIILETGEKDFWKWNDYYKLRLIVDFVSGMTDNFALKLYQELQGIKYE